MSEEESERKRLKVGDRKRKWTKKKIRKVIEMKESGWKEADGKDGIKVGRTEGKGMRK